MRAEMLAWATMAWGATLTWWTSAWAQSSVSATGAPPRSYTKKATFSLPVRMDPRERSQCREVQLHVKHGPDRPWIMEDRGPATVTKFDYRAPGDGEYWFTVVTVDAAGRSVPEDLSREPPLLIVVVDSQPPEVELRPHTGVDGEVLVQCLVRDANPDPSKTKVEYQDAEGRWHALEAVRGKPACYRLPGPWALRQPLRVSACDRCGNRTEKETPRREPVVSQPGENCILPVGHQTRTDKPTPREISAAVASPAKPLAHPPSPHLHGGTHVRLDYEIEQIGASGISKVEVWLTRDEGCTWQRHCADDDCQSPVEFDLPGDGIYGLLLVVGSNPATGGAAPAKGEPADWWIEVDTTKPDAKLLGVKPGDDVGSWDITWSASDRNLGPDPVTLVYSCSSEGPWLPIAKGLKKEGSFRWKPKNVGAEVFVRIEARDRAGNLAVHDWAHPVLLETARPRAKILGVSTTAAKPTTPLSGN
jgi:hypothetical protein